MEKKHFWLQNLIWLYDRGTPVRLGGIALLCLALAEKVWMVLEASGRRGSPIIVTGLIGGAALVAGLLLLLTSSLRWSLLYVAVKSYVRKHLLPDLMNPQCLVGIGPGGAIAVGLVTKILRELKYDPPPILVFDMAYKQQGTDPVIGSLWPTRPVIDASRCWIIQGNVNSGRSLRKLREQYALQEARVFAFVVSDAAALREHVDHYMAVGSRAILPWPTEKPPDRAE